MDIEERTITLGFEAFFTGQQRAEVDKPIEGGRKILGIIGGNLRIAPIAADGRIKNIQENKIGVVLARVRAGSSRILSLSLDTRSPMVAIPSHVFSTPVDADTIHVSIEAAGYFPINAELQLVLERGLS